jgi:hypothetical protein
LYFQNSHTLIQNEKQKPLKKEKTQINPASGSQTAGKPIYRTLTGCLNVRYFFGLFLELSLPEALAAFVLKRQQP